MPYRVDFAVGLMVLGFLIGLASARCFSNVSSVRIARTFYCVTAAFLVVGFVLSVYALLVGSQLVRPAFGIVMGIVGSLFSWAVLGVAVRDKTGALASEPLLLATYTMSTAFTFAFAGLGKALNVASMTTFFAQSGYSVVFLKFIIIAEVLGGVGLLVSWSFLPALIGLTIDMIGAVITHIHNGDPLNDNTGAIGMLIRLGLIGTLWMMRRRPEKLRLAPLRVGLLVGSVALACSAVAVVGSIAVRHANHDATNKSANKAVLLWGLPNSSEITNQANIEPAVS